MGHVFDDADRRRELAEVQGSSEERLARAAALVSAWLARADLLVPGEPAVAYRAWAEGEGTVDDVYAALGGRLAEDDVRPAFREELWEALGDSLIDGRVWELLCELYGERLATLPADALGAAPFFHRLDRELGRAPVGAPYSPGPGPTISVLRQFGQPHVPMKPADLMAELQLAGHGLAMGLQQLSAGRSAWLAFDLSGGQRVHAIYNAGEPRRGRWLVDPRKGGGVRALHHVTQFAMSAVGDALDIEIPHLSKQDHEECVKQVRLGMTAYLEAQRYQSDR